MPLPLASSRYTFHDAGRRHHSCASRNCSSCTGPDNQAGSIASPAKCMSRFLQHSLDLQSFGVPLRRCFRCDPASRKPVHALRNMHRRHHHMQRMSLIEDSSCALDSRDFPWLESFPDFSGRTPSSPSCSRACSSGRDTGASCDSRTRSDPFLHRKSLHTFIVASLGIALSTQLYR